jgi:hypothetical protein
MHRLITLIAISVTLAGSIAAASDVKIVTTSKPSSTAPVKFTKTVVLVASPDADLRRRAEAGLARRMRNAVAATVLMPNADLSNRDAVKAALRESGADGLVLVRPLGVEEDLNMEATEQYILEYPSLWGYWDSQFMVVTRPGAVSIDKVFTVEIAIYAIADERIVWAGRMKAANPKSLRVFLDEMVEEGSKELKRQKLI